MGLISFLNFFRNIFVKYQQVKQESTPIEFLPGVKEQYDGELVEANDIINRHCECHHCCKDDCDRPTCNEKN